MVEDRGLTPSHCPPRQLLGARVHPDLSPALLHHHGHHQPLDIHRPAGLLLRGPPLQQGLGDTDPAWHHVLGPSQSSPNPDPANGCSTTGHRSRGVRRVPCIDSTSRIAPQLITPAPGVGSFKNDVKIRAALLSLQSQPSTLLSVPPYCRWPHLLEAHLSSALNEVQPAFNSAIPWSPSLQYMSLL